MSAAQFGRHFGFRDATVLTRWLIALLALSMTVAVVSVVSNGFELAALDAPDYPERAEANAIRQAVVGLAQFIVAIATIVVFCCWIYRANWNARALGAVGMTFTPGWSVGWYFIPIASLWKPFQAMREIWKASAAPSGWQLLRTDALLGWWWFGFVVSNILDHVAGRLMFAAEEAPALRSATLIGLVSDVGDFAATALALALVRRLYRMQMERRPQG